MGTSFCPCINRENEKNEAIFGEPKLNEIKNQNSADIDMGKNKIVIKENNNNKKIFKKRKEFDKKLCELIFQSLPKRIRSQIERFEPAPANHKCTEGKTKRRGTTTLAGYR